MWVVFLHNIRPPPIIVDLGGLNWKCFNLHLQYLVQATSDKSNILGGRKHLDLSEIRLYYNIQQKNPDQKKKIVSYRSTIRNWCMTYIWKNSPGLYSADIKQNILNLNSFCARAKLRVATEATSEVHKSHPYRATLIMYIDRSELHQ